MLPKSLVIFVVAAEALQNGVGKLPKLGFDSKALPIFGAMRELY